MAIREQMTDYFKLRSQFRAIRNKFIEDKEILEMNEFWKYLTDLPFLSNLPVPG